MKRENVVLITGCSSGIGRALSEEFHRRGHRVVATARRLETLEDLRARGMTTERLDVTNAADAGRVIAAVLARLQRIDILVNNAGYGLMGPSLDLSEVQLIDQFRTNVFAPLSLIQLVAPSMRNHGGGTIVNIGSISGIAPTPFAGAYCASKAALHALSDVLRMELSPFGINVVTVEAGGVESNFGNASGVTAREVLTDRSWYASIGDSIVARAKISQLHAMGSDEFASRLVSAIESARPPASVRIGSRSFSLPLMKRALPTRILDGGMKRRFGLTKLK